MNRFVALALMIVVPVAGVMLTYRPVQEGSQGGLEAPIDSLTIIDAAAMLHEEAQKRTKLDAEFLIVGTRIAQKREIARKVIDNTLTLSEAAVLFRSIIADCPYSHMVYAANQGSSEDERIFRDVIGWVEGEFVDDPLAQALAVATLEEEMKALFP